MQVETLEPLGLRVQLDLRVQQVALERLVLQAQQVVLEPLVLLARLDLRVRRVAQEALGLLVLLARLGLQV